MKFHAKMGSVKDRNRMDLTEAEDIKKRWQEYTEELDKRLIHLFLGWDGSRFHPTVGNGVRLKTYELVSSGIFPLMFWTQLITDN